MGFGDGLELGAGSGVVFAFTDLGGDGSGRTGAVRLLFTFTLASGSKLAFGSKAF